MARKRSLPSYPGSRSLYASLGFITFIEAISITAQAVFLARAVTFLFEGAGISDVLKEIAFFFIAFMIRHLLSLLQSSLSERFAEKLGKDLREKLISAYFQLGQQFAQVYGTGRLVTLAIEGIEDMKKYIEITIPRMIRTFIVPTFIVIYVFTLDVPSSAILVVAIPIIIIFMILLGLAAQKMADKQYETYRILSNHFIDSLKGLETLKYLGQSKKHEKKISDVSQKYRKATIRTLRIAFLSSFALDFFTSLSIAFVAVGLGFRLVDGAILLLPALTILILAPEYFMPIRQVGKDYHATLDGQIALDEIEQIIELQPAKQDISSDSKLDWSSTSSVQLDKVSVSYEENPILTDISFSWTGNGMIGIVGPSGAGKSTLINMLAGFLQPNNGEILINNTTTNTLNREDWLEQIAYIPQHPYIFPTSLADNIRFYEPNASDSDVLNAIEEIGMKPFVEQLPDGINESIGEGGRILSGGQEQRIAMARALLSNRPIILLDEPTAHLDIETEYEIKQVMLRVFKDKLVFFATHRMHWMKQMDYLLLLDNGHLVQQGTHNELLIQEGQYNDLMTSVEERRKRI